MKKIVLSIVALTASTLLMAEAVNAGACTGCHGADWSKPALGKSKDVSKMS